jgi:hypothetical protein
MGQIKQKRGLPMKTKLAQLSVFASKFDHRSLQLAYFALALAGAVLLRAPLDGGGGPH